VSAFYSFVLSCIHNLTVKLRQSSRHHLSKNKQPGLGCVAQVIDHLTSKQKTLHSKAQYDHLKKATHTQASKQKLNTG
jgi:hypothetical protein